MTVIAYRDGIMAADTSSWTGDIVFGSASKIYRLRDGSLLGMAGWVPVLRRTIEWIEAGADPKEKPAPAPDKSDIDIILVRPDREIWYVHENFEFWKADNQDIAVAGSHHEFLIGALLAGASAPDAVRLAIDYCAKAAGKVEWKRLDGSL